MDRSDLLEQKLGIIKKDLEDAMTKLYQEMGQALARLATNIAKDISSMEERIKVLEQQADKSNKPRDPSSGGREL